MLEFTVGISLLAGICFLVLIIAYIFEWKTIKTVVSCAMSALALISMVFFYYIQKTNGNPDQGMEFWQLYFPILIYVFFIVFGAGSFVVSIKQKQR